MFHPVSAFILSPISCPSSPSVLQLHRNHCFTCSAATPTASRCQHVYLVPPPCADYYRTSPHYFLLLCTVWAAISVPHAMKPMSLKAEKQTSRNRAQLFSKRGCELFKKLQTASLVWIGIDPITYQTYITCSGSSEPLSALKHRQAIVLNSTALDVCDWGMSAQLNSGKLRADEVQTLTEFLLLGASCFLNWTTSE